MKTSTKILMVIAIVSVIAIAGATVSAGTTTSNYYQNDTVQDFHIDKDGYITIKQAKVFQIAGTSFYIRYHVGMAFIRVLVKTDANTKVYRRFGDEISLSQISTGDTVNIEGKIESGADSLSIFAKKLVNFSNQQEIAGFSGTIEGSDVDGNLILNAKNQGVITLNIGTTTQIRKGNRIITSNLVRKGDIVTSAVGTFDHATQKLDSNVIVVNVDMKIYAERNFQGTLKAIGSGERPSMTVNTEGKDYSIVMTDNTEIMNRLRKAVSTQRFVVGDTIRIYGNIREAEEPIIDAQIVRNISL